jgi:murein DD-endopeptidase MepM/ murein hydrolase activator NlpD
MRRLAPALCLVLIGSSPVYAQSSGDVTPEDVAAADAERRAAAARLVEATAEYEANAVRAEELQGELQSRAVDLSVRERDLALTRSRAMVIIREQYVTGGGRGVLALFDTGSISDLTSRERYLDLVAESDAATLKRLAALQASFEEQQALLEAAFGEQVEVTATLDLLATRILGELEDANARHAAVTARFQAQEEERRRAEEEARRRAEEEARRRAEEEARRRAEEAARAATTTTAPPTTTTAAPGGDTPAATTSTTAAPSTTTTTAPPPPPPPATTGKVCPVDGAVAFVDSWGAPRSGGRRHQGVDMIAARGTPVVALESGVVRRMRNGGLGGITVWLRADSGDEYYYAHLDAWAPGLSVGDRLPAGGALGTVGNTGNARYTIPHLHFEYHPGGGAAVNPYPLTARLCL